MDLHTIADALEFAPAIGAANLTMYPLLHGDETVPGYATLDEALAAGFVTVTEVSEAGSVPELTILNNGSVPVFVLDGEELVGAKQNRIVNLSILVPARTKLPLPVSCVEAHRWQHRTRTFAAAGRAHYASGRAMNGAEVSCSLRTHGERAGNQRDIWADIDAKAMRMEAPSATRAAAAMYEKARADLDAFQAKLEAVPRQVGAVFAINGAIVGLELFDNAATWRKSMRKIVESYGLDALDRHEAKKARARRDPKRFLKSVSATEVESFKAVGLGEDLRLRSPRIAGAALAVDQKVVHLLAYAC